MSIFKYLIKFDGKYFLALICLTVNIIVLFPFSKLNAQTQIRGKTGGGVNTRDCGFISSKPNHTLNLKQKTDYLRVSLRANGGQPTLLIVGPGSQDRFCVLGDSNMGVHPELSGVWESGKYLIFVGDLKNSGSSFTLNISSQK